MMLKNSQEWVSSKTSVYVDVGVHLHRTPRHGVVCTYSGCPAGVQSKDALTFAQPCGCTNMDELKHCDVIGVHCAATPRDDARNDRFVGMLSLERATYALCISGSRVATWLVERLLDAKMPSRQRLPRSQRLS